AQRARTFLAQPSAFAAAARGKGRTWQGAVDGAPSATRVAAPLSIDLVPVDTLSPRHRRRRVAAAVLAPVMVGAAAAALVFIRGDRGTATAVQPVRLSQAPSKSASALLRRSSQAPKPRASRGVRSRAPSAHPRKALRVTNASRTAAVKVKTSSHTPANATRRPKVFTKSAHGRKTSSGFVPARVFAWPAHPRASAYIVRFFRNG